MKDVHNSINKYGTQCTIKDKKLSNWFQRKCCHKNGNFSSKILLLKIKVSCLASVTPSDSPIFKISHTHLHTRIYLIRKRSEKFRRYNIIYFSTALSKPNHIDKCWCSLYGEREANSFGIPLPDICEQFYTT